MRRVESRSTRTEFIHKSDTHPFPACSQFFLYILASSTDRGGAPNLAWASRLRAGRPIHIPKALAPRPHVRGR